MTWASDMRIQRESRGKTSPQYLKRPQPERFLVRLRSYAGAMARWTGVIPLLISVGASSFGQQHPTEPSASFRSEVREVLVSFNVARDSYFALDVKPEDVVLLEDGKPRTFSFFEGPGTGRRPPLEIVLLFDTTTLPPPESATVVMNTYWDREATYDFARHWGDDDSRAVLAKGGADVRVSVYRFEDRAMQRLCRSATDPQTLGNAMRRLLSPIPSGEAIPLTLPPGRRAWVSHDKPDPLTKSPRVLTTPQSWTLEATIDALKDCATFQNSAVRVLVVFTEASGRRTTTTLEDVTSQAISLGIPIYPVVLDYEKYQSHPFARRRTAGGWVGFEATLMAEFGGIGKSTSGRAFFPPEVDAEMIGKVLEVIRNEGLSRYVLGFQPPASAKQRLHNLEVKLKSKATGKIMSGKRTAVY